jgi:hypothetical protein
MGRPCVTELSGYVLETLREGRVFTLYRGRQPGKAVPILLLAPVPAQQAPSTLGQLEHEFALAQELEPAWAARPRALARHDGQRVLVHHHRSPWRASVGIVEPAPWQRLSLYGAKPEQQDLS